MTIEKLNTIQAEESVEFRLKPGERFIVVGTDSAITKALARLTGPRDEIAKLLRERDGDVEPVVERVIATNVPSLAIQRANYTHWLLSKSGYYRPTPEQMDKMFSVLEEGDEVLPDFAHSFTIRRQDGLLLQVDRRGRISEPSIYSPALKQSK
jgi:hypothetical protein